MSKEEIVKELERMYHESSDLRKYGSLERFEYLREDLANLLDKLFEEM